MAEKESVMEQAWQHYLKLVDLKEEDMHPTQRVETRRAFFGGSGQMMVRLKQAAEGTGEETMEELLPKLTEEITDFWLKELGRTN